MSEIEMLKQQKKEIEARIRELSQKSITAGEARIGMERYPTSKPDRWYLGINVQYVNYPYFRTHSSSFRTVVNASTKAEVIEAIPYIIQDLQELYDKAKTEGA